MKTLHILQRMILVMMIAALLPLAAHAQEAPELNWSVEGGELCISCEGEMVLGDQIPWADYRSEIKAVRIDDGVTSIAPGAFAECTALKSVTLPNTLYSIGTDAFRGCTKLYWATLPEDTAVIESGAFLGCSGLKTIVIPQNTTDIAQDAFEQSIRIRGYSGSAAEDYAKSRGCSFSSCGSRKCSAAEGMIGDLCWKLDAYGNMTLSAAQTDAAGVWQNHRGDIKTLTIEQGVTALEKGLFRNCRRLSKVELPEGLTAIGQETFASCTALKEITVPDSVKEIGEAAFDASVVLYGGEGSAAEKYAQDNKLEFQLTAPETEEPVEETEAPIEEITSEETKTPAEETASEETEAPAEETIPEETEAPAEETIPEETEAPAEETAPEETEAPTEETIPEETEEPAEETVPEETEEPVEENALVLSLSSRTAKAGDTVEVLLSAQNNPGICGLSFDICADDAVLTLKGYDGLAVDMGQNDWTFAIGKTGKALWICGSPCKTNGDLLRLTFSVNADVDNMESKLQLLDVMAVDESGNQIPVKAEPAVITVEAGLPGDVNNDGEVTGADSLLLKQYLVGLMTREEICNADVNGDGQIDLADALCLDRFLAGELDALR